MHDLLIKAWQGTARDRATPHVRDLSIIRTNMTDFGRVYKPFFHSFRGSIVDKGVERLWIMRRALL